MPPSVIGRWPLLAPPLGDAIPLPYESQRRGGGGGRGVGALLSWRREADGRGGGRSRAPGGCEPAETEAELPGQLEREGARSWPMVASRATKGGVLSRARSKPVVAASLPAPLPSLPPLLFSSAPAPGSARRRRRRRSPSR